MKKLITILLFSILTCSITFAQGVFNSAGSGDWTSPGTWTLVSGTDDDGVPDANDDVTILATHVVNINDDVVCNNLTFQAGADIFFNTENKSLTVNGNINGAATSEDYTSGTNASGTKLIIAGTGAQSTSATSGGASTNWPNVDVNKSGGTFTLGQNMRIDGNLAIIAGTMDANTSAISMSATSAITVANGTSLIKIGRIATSTSGTSPIGSLSVNGDVSGTNFYITDLTVNSGGILDMTGTTGFSASANPTTMTCNTGSTVKYSASAAQTGRFVDYYNLELSGTSDKTISAVGTLTVWGNFTLSGSARVLTGGSWVIKGTTSFGNTSAFRLNASNSATFDGNVTNSSTAASGALQYGGVYTTTPTYTFNGDLSLTGAGVFINSNSATTGIDNRSFTPIININGNCNVNVAGTFMSVSSTDPASIHVKFGGTDKILAINVGSSSFINLRGNYTFTTSREIQTNSGTNFTFTTRPNTVSPEWFIKIDNGVTLTIAAGTTINLPNRSFSDGTGAGNLVINGDLRMGLAGGWNSTITNTGTTSLGTSSTITFNGTLAQSTGSNLPALNNLTVNNSNGISLDNALTVDGTLTFTLGKVTLGTNNLTVGSTGSISGATSTRYIVTNSTGVLTRNLVGASNISFPIGTSSSYAPATINNAGTTDDFSVRAKTTYTNNPNNVNHVAIFWDINEAEAGGSDVTLTLQWNSGDENPGFNRNSDLHIGRYTGTAWVGTSAILGGTDPYTATASGFNTFSEFGVGSDGALPVELSSFIASVSGNKVQLRWQTATEIDNYGFEIEKAINTETDSPLSWEKIAFIAGHGNSNSPKDYSFTDNNLPTGTYSYRLKQIDNDGSYEYSNSVEVDIEIPKEFALMQNYPNPFNPVTNINYTIPVDSKVMLVIYSISGEKVAELVNESQTAGNYSIPFNASHLASGTYVYRLIANDFVQTKKMLLIK
jgi:hypothetical protein